MLVYEETHKEEDENKVLSEKERERQHHENTQEALHRKWRNKFIKNLRRTGVNLEMVSICTAFD